MARSLAQSGLAARVRSLSVWTRDKAKAAARELEQAMAEIQEDGLSSADQPSLAGEDSTRSDPEPLWTQNRCETETDEADAEARNRPFYELVRGSMAEAIETNGPDTFERWLRQFHSERDDEWFANNRTRVYNAFRPHWDEVVAKGATDK
ncbi:unnamed protein product [Durusdinium trenchii]|uniref:Uncharacterized protein n=1 Tax=Durusdinium trenchii TaxID=1381693 RepID=A0ABP0JKH2_9DINO